MMRRPAGPLAVAALLAAVWLAPAPLAAAEAPALSCKLVPGWTQHGPIRAFTPDTLYEYMNGNSEGYLLYGFKKMTGLTCKRGEITFVIDVSDMGDADSAYGMLAATRDARQPGNSLGMGGQIVPRRGIFSKGQYYVEIAASPEGDHTADLTAWLTAIEKLTPGRTAAPDAMSWFPTARQTSLRLVPESVLGIRILKRGYVGQYEYGKAFVIFEESPAAAAATMDKWKTRLGETAPAQIGEAGFQATDKYLGRLAVFRKGRFLGGWSNVAEGSDPLKLAAELLAKLP
jgi:hypothetical protein